LRKWVAWYLEWVGDIHVTIENEYTCDECETYNDCNTYCWQPETSISKPKKPLPSKKSK